MVARFIRFVLTSFAFSSGFFTWLEGGMYMGRDEFIHHVYGHVYTILYRCAIYIYCALVLALCCVITITEKTTLSPFILSTSREKQKRGRRMRRRRNSLRVYVTVCSSLWFSGASGVVCGGGEEEVVNTVVAPHSFGFDSVSSAIAYIA